MTVTGAGEEGVLPVLHFDLTELNVCSHLMLYDSSLLLTIQTAPTTHMLTVTAFRRTF